MAKFLGLDYEIVYKKGRENSVADALSRLPESDFQAKISVINTVQCGWLADVLQSYDSDATAQSVIQGIAEKKEAFQDYQYSQGLIKYNKGFMWEPMEISGRKSFGNFMMGRLESIQARKSL